MCSTDAALLPTKQNVQHFLAEDVDKHYSSMYLLFQQDIRNYIAYKLHAVKSQEAIDDCVQETFERAYSALKRKSPENILELDYFRAWLIAIAENVVLRWQEKNSDYFTTVLPRTRTRIKIFFESIELKMSESGEQRLDVADRDELKQPETALVWKEKRTELREYVNMLPEQYRIAIRLHYFNELKLEQIASQRKLALNTVKAHVYRGIKMLSDYFAVVQALDETKEMVTTSIRMIPSSCGTVMRLHFLEGMKLPDVAIRCNYSNNKVKRLLYHGANIVITHLQAKNERGK
jgi:RNA polymerase sigma factor (sigma-70 family)